MTARTSFLAFILAFISIALAGCFSTPPLSPEPAPSDAPYTLQKGDVINVTVYGDELLSGERTVNQDGAITLPLIGDVVAEGLSKDALRDSIAGALTEGDYLSTPQVTVDIAQYRPVYLSGEVRTAGSYDFIPGLTLLKALSLAGGLSPKADSDTIVVSRENGENVIHFKALMTTELQPGDSIVVYPRLF